MKTVNDEGKRNAPIVAVDLSSGSLETQTLSVGQIVHCFEYPGTASLSLKS